MKQIEEMANEIYKTLMLEADCSLSGTELFIGLSFYLLESQKESINYLQ